MQISIVMNDELREKWMALGQDLINLVIERTDSAAEAYAFLTQVMLALKSSHGIKGAILVEQADGEAN